MPTLRSGRVVQWQARRTRGFSVRGRACAPDPANMLVTAEPDLARLAQSMNVRAAEPLAGHPAELINAILYEHLLDEQDQPPRRKHLLLGYGRGWLYYGVAGLGLRGPRANAAAPSGREQWPDAPAHDDQLAIAVIYDQPPTAGSTSPGRNAVMKGSARNYAAEMLGSGWARERSWEWLHVVGHAIGGDNEVGNLVAGTYDANTQMIPMETRIQRLCEEIRGEDEWVSAHWEVGLFPGTWVATDLTMNVFFHGRGSTPQEWTLHVPCTSNLRYDRLLYDLHARS